MPVNVYREYRIKSYLNARHYIVVNGKQGDVHPHTWEFSLQIRFARGNFIEFAAFEKGIAEYLAPYQNTVLNDMEPFDAIIPTVENMTDYFADAFYKVVQGIGGVLLQVEASETPTRSYILNLANDESCPVTQDEEALLSTAIDHVLDDILN